MGNKASPVNSDGFWWDKDREISSFQNFRENMTNIMLEKVK